MSRIRSTSVLACTNAYCLIETCCFYLLNAFSFRNISKSCKNLLPWPDLFILKVLFLFSSALSMFYQIYNLALSITDERVDILSKCAAGVWTLIPFMLLYLYFIKRIPLHKEGATQLDRSDGACIPIHN